MIDDDKRLYYVAYVLPNHSGDDNGGIWKVEAKNPDEALGKFLEHIKPQEAKIVGCTEDNDAACDRLLKERGY